jgi:hypothetical protein
MRNMVNTFSPAVPTSANPFVVRVLDVVSRFDVGLGRVEVEHHGAVLSTGSWSSVWYCLEGVQTRLVLYVQLRFDLV